MRISTLTPLDVGFSSLPGVAEQAVADPGVGWAWNLGPADDPRGPTRSWEPALRDVVTWFELDKFRALANRHVGMNSPTATLPPIAVDVEVTVPLITEAVTGLRAVRIRPDSMDAQGNRTESPVQTDWELIDGDYRVEDAEFSFTFGAGVPAWRLAVYLMDPDQQRLSGRVGVGTPRVRFTPTGGA